MRKTVKLISLFTILLLVLACGKKTDPIPKSQFIPPAEDEVFIEVVKGGVLVKNNDKDYNLIVQKSACEGCGGVFKELATIKPEGQFLDRDVKEKEQYFYKFMFKHPRYDIYSNYFIKRITYLKQVAIKNIEIIPIDNKTISINLDFTDTIRHYKLYINDELYYDGRNERLEGITLKERYNKVSILPYDIYNNKGRLYAQRIDTFDLNRPKKVENIDYVFDDGNLYISWDRVNYADKYSLKIKIDGRVMEFAQEVNYFKTQVPQHIKCIDIGLQAENDFFKSGYKNIEICR
ncbi:MAG: hypothetical protein SVN78_04095 [Deferribacterota bacterium]|nr:hypothetical protein [Deferribacterota bacterium]